jgi:hypothetical protein
MNRYRFALSLFATLALCAAVGWMAKGWLDVDACLDAGGAWQHSGQYCAGIDVK